MSVDYQGKSFRHDWRTNTYSRPPVKVRYPCSKCGSERPQKIIQSPSGGIRIEILKCCSGNTS